MGSPEALPLAGLRIIEFAGVGPGPFCGMMLADNGAEVIRIDRPGGALAGIPIDGGRDVMLRSRRSISLDLKSADGLLVAKRLCASADGIFEGFRPGVMERLGLGPETLLADNPQLVYGRMTGWGQDGPLSALPGHDINYLATSGVLDAVGNGAVPRPPLNILGDYAGGGLLLAFGMVTALLAVCHGARGKVIDCAMAEGASALLAGIWTLRNNGDWSGERGSNLLDGGAPFYGTYAASDGKFLTLGAIEPQFYARLIELLELSDDPDFADQLDREKWPVMRARLADCFARRSSAEWDQMLSEEEVCYAPVWTMSEAPDHPHNVARKAFLTVDGMVQPAPVPRFGGCEPRDPSMWQENSDRDELLRELGFTTAEIGHLETSRIVENDARMGVDD